MAFDSYHKWLGIPPADQPPNYYRLLTLTLFESDPEVIDAAADRQMAYLRQCATGPHRAEAQKLLQEVASARLCLLVPKSKRKYDAELKLKTAALAHAGRKPDFRVEAIPTTCVTGQEASDELVTPGRGHRALRQDRRVMIGAGSVFVFATILVFVVGQSGQQLNERHRPGEHADGTNQQSPKPSSSGPRKPGAGADVAVASRDKILRSSLDVHDVAKKPSLNLSPEAFDAGRATAPSPRKDSLPPSMNAADETNLNPPSPQESEAAHLKSEGEKGVDTPMLARWRFNGNAKNEVLGGSEFALKQTTFQDNALYLNGKYELERGGDGFRAVGITPPLDYRHFTVALRFKADDSAPQRAGAPMPLLVGSTSMRWFGLHMISNDLYVSFNNQQFFRRINGVQIKRGDWIVIACGVDLDDGNVIVYSNRKKGEELRLPEGFKLEVAAPQYQGYPKEWTFTNYSNGLVFHGLVDELIIYPKILSGAEFEGIPLKP